jgi:hypothetical protein
MHSLDSCIEHPLCRYRHSYSFRPYPVPDKEMVEGEGYMDVHDAN